jgi:hypothetical protein
MANNNEPNPDNGYIQPNKTTPAPQPRPSIFSTEPKPGTVPPWGRPNRS